jgi:hypothetical protein
MMNHPWMKLELEKNKSLGNAKDKLEKYMSVRKELSYRQNKD